VVGRTWTHSDLRGYRAQREMLGAIGADHRRCSGDEGRFEVAVVIVSTGFE
jgi:hypothetical protein